MLHQNLVEPADAGSLFVLRSGCCKTAARIGPVDFSAGTRLGEAPAFGYKRHLRDPNQGGLNARI
jgi:hypothetical protein